MKNLLMSVLKQLHETRILNLQVVSRYVESGQYAYGVRPWVWIIVLAFGPLFSSMFFTHYLSVSVRDLFCLVNPKPTKLVQTRQVTVVESVITQLIFEHSLRIRMRSDALEPDKNPVDLTKRDPKSDTSSIASGSGATSDDETLATSSQSTITARADGEDVVAKDETTDDIVVEAEAEEDEEFLEEIEENTHAVNAKPKTGDLIGKINSLATTDLGDVTYLQNALNLRE